MSHPPIRDTILSALSEARSFDELGRAIVDTCASAVRAEVCTIWCRYSDDDGPGLRLLAASAKAPQTLAQDITYRLNEADPDGADADGVTAFVAQTRREVHVSSFEQLKAEYGHVWKGRMDKTQWDEKPEDNFHSLSAFPLLVGQVVVGVLKLENKFDANATIMEEGFTQEDRNALLEVLPDIALAVHAATLLESHEERLIKSPAQMVTAILGPSKPQDLVSQIVKTVADSVSAELCSLWLVDPSGHELHLAEGYGFDTAQRSKQTYQLSSPDAPDADVDGITAWVAVRKQPFWANSWEQLKEHPSWKGKWDAQMWEQRAERFRCLYAVPLLRHGPDGVTVLGVLKVENRLNAAMFNDSDRTLCGIMASLIVLALDLGQQLRMTLISDFAHLIRSPLAQVSMNLQVLEREIQMSKSGQPLRHDRIELSVDFIKKAALSALITSRTLVAFAQRSSHQTGNVEVDSVPIATLVDERVREIRPLLDQGKQIDWVPSCGAETLMVGLDVTDRTRLTIVIDNILHNAIKFSPESSVVQITLAPSGDKEAVLRIADLGPGIDETDLGRIWEAGFTRRADKHPEGTGMGLTTVKQILDQFRWKYDVSLNHPVGTVFSITIPLESEA